MFNNYYRTSPIIDGWPRTAFWPHGSHLFTLPLGITQTAFAKHIGITNARLSEIIHGKRPVTMNSALRFERALGLRAESWMRMQLTVDIFDALRGRRAKSVGRIKPIARAS